MTKKVKATACKSMGTVFVAREYKLVSLAATLAGESRQDFLRNAGLARAIKTLRQEQHKAEAVNFFGW